MSKWEYTPIHAKSAISDAGGREGPRGREDGLHRRAAPGGQDHPRPLAPRPEGLGARIRPTSTGTTRGPRRACGGSSCRRTSRSSSATRCTSTPAGATWSRGSTTRRSRSAASSSPVRPGWTTTARAATPLPTATATSASTRSRSASSTPTAPRIAPRRAAQVRRVPGAALSPGRSRAPHLAARSPGAGSFARTCATWSGFARSASSSNSSTSCRSASARRCRSRT